MKTFDYAQVRGFNYQPSYAWNTYEAWRFFDEAVFDLEIGRGKKYFPKMNTVRIWLSYDAFRYEEDRQAENFEKVLKICDKYGCKVIPVLFNCWHDAFMDVGGIYHSQMIPGSNWAAQEYMFDSYIEKIVKPHKDDERILAWDICNEPYSYDAMNDFVKFVMDYETAWLKKMCLMCKATGIIQPIGISLAYVTDLPKVADFTDIYMVHPYYLYRDEMLKEDTAPGFDSLMSEIRAMGEQYDMPILSTETCWGSRVDANRAEIVRRTLEAHNKAGWGYIVHALNYSHIPDLHDECDGPVGNPGNLAFVGKDGNIRPGHEVYNELA